jgi:hypothetical protein
MSSWFSNTNIDDIPDNPNELPNNTYHFKVTDAQLKPTKDSSKTGITFRYQIIKGSWSNFFPLVDWVRVPDDKVSPDQLQRLLSYLKMRLLAFGFTPEEIQEFGPDSEKKCIGREFYGTTSIRKDENTGNTNVKVVKFDPIGDGADTLIDFGNKDGDTPF